MNADAVASPDLAEGSKDPVALAALLIRAQSVTPKDAGALDILAGALQRLGFVCHPLVFGGGESEPVRNLYARLGSGRPNLCFAGHTDVVPPGEPEGWRFDPFAGNLCEGALYGRGAVDMKGAVAAFVAAASQYLDEAGEGFSGSLSLLVTGDEEGEAKNGTKKVLEWLEARGETLDACLVGEPTSEKRLGDTIKIGRRGSLNARLTASGVQGHTAYPHLADNAAHRLIRMLGLLLEKELDQGSEHFPPSTLQVSTIDIGNRARNIIPAKAEAVFNIRFNDLWSAKTLEQALRERLDAAGGRYALDIAVSGESFLAPKGPLVEALGEAIERVTGLTPVLGTGGGTSDARFLHAYCPVVEFGLVGQLMHKIDERVPLAELRQLSEIYRAFLALFFAKTASNEWR